MKYIALILSIFCVTLSYAQIRIDGDFEFEDNPNKKYSLFIPPGYNPDVPHKTMLALHPFNPDRWDSESWCDTLIQFGMLTDLILICPDGDEDGQIDDPIDTAFTSALIDSVGFWYNLNAEKTYAMGFSWGGKTTYTYGLNHINDFNGFMPIGAAINGTDEIDDVIALAANKPWYLVHGEDDSPNARFYPLLEGLNENGGITNSLLMEGVDHTIDFDNRDQILADAFFWIDSVNCATSGLETIEASIHNINIYPQPASNGSVSIEITTQKAQEIWIVVMDPLGKMIRESKMVTIEGKNKFNLDSLDVAGAYLIYLKGEGWSESEQFIIN